MFSASLRLTLHFSVFFQMAACTTTGWVSFELTNSITLNAIISSRRCASVDQRRPLQRLLYPRKLYRDPQPMVRTALFQNTKFSFFLQRYSIGQCQTTSETTQNPASSGQSAFYEMENWTIPFEIRWISHLDSVGGEHDELFIYSFHPSISHHHHYHLGRICPGQHLAHSTITLAAASILSNFNLQKELDKNHQEIEPKREYKLSAIWYVSSIVLHWDCLH